MPVALRTLKPGTAFRAPWRPEGEDIGELLEVGVGSCRVRIPEHDGASWGKTNWSPNTLVEPTTVKELRAQSLTSDGSLRAKSTTESPVATVHRICDEMKGKPRDEIIQACINEGVNPNTAKTQYYKWRKQQ